MVGLLALAGCTAVAGQIPSLDGGVDAGLDGGILFDGGSLNDGGDAHDSGLHDAGLLHDSGTSDAGVDPCSKCTAPAWTCSGGVLTERTPTCVASMCGVSTVSHGCASPSVCGVDAKGVANCVGRPAKGVLDVADDVGVAGWACDPDTPWRATEVHAYFDGPAGAVNATGIPGIWADRPSESGVNTTCAGGLFHRFLFTMGQAQAAKLSPGVHGVWTYAISNGASESNSQLNPFPKWFPVPATEVSATYTPGLEKKALPKAGGINGGPYVYGPAMVRTQGEYHLWSCNADGVHLGDSIGYVHSTDGITWSAPTTVLYMPTELSPSLFHTCDPSVVQFTPPGSTTPYFYMYYSAHNHPAGGWGTINSVARSTSLSGPFRHYMGGDPNNDANWVQHPTAAMPAVLQHGNVQCASNCYGVGQPSVVLRGNTLFMWFNVANDAVPSKVGLYRTTSTDGVTWTTPVQTTLPSSQVAVKWDPASKRYVMFGVVKEYTGDAAFQVRTSVDGLTWVYVGAEIAMPDYAAEWGMSGDERGFLHGGTTLLGFAAPYNLMGPKKCVDGECELFVTPLSVTWK